MGKPRRLPRKFSMPWGDGQVVEEVGIDTEHNELVIQLLQYDEYPDRSIRFCQYWLDGRFQRQPMMISEVDVGRMRQALKDAPELRAILKQLVD